MLPGFDELVLADASSDPLWSNVVFLLSGTGTTITDDSAAANACSAAGDAQFTTSQFKFGTSSLVLDGSGDYISIGALGSSNFNFGANPFCLEGWFRWNTFAADKALFSNFGGLGSLGPLIRTSGSGEIEFRCSDNGGGSVNKTFITSGAGITTGTWYHIAFSKDASGKVRGFVDGVMRGSLTGVGTVYQATSAALRIGGTSIPDRYLDGWVDEVRVTKGEGRYVSDTSFSPPAAAFPRA